MDITVMLSCSVSFKIATRTEYVLNPNHSVLLLYYPHHWAAASPRPKCTVEVSGLGSLPDEPQTPTQGSLELAGCSHRAPCVLTGTYSANSKFVVFLPSSSRKKLLSLSKPSARRQQMFRTHTFAHVSSWSPQSVTWTIRQISLSSIFNLSWKKKWVRKLPMHTF